MPDISKLPELAELFGTTIDALLGRSSPLIEHAAEGKLDELPSLTVDELAEAAPLLPPKQLESLTNTLMGLTELPDMTGLLPFLPTEKVDVLLRHRIKNGESLVNYAVFASTGAVDAAVRELESQGQSIGMLAPFANQHVIDGVAQARLADGKSFTELCAFISSGMLTDLARKLESQGQSCVAYAPFLPESQLNDITLARLQSGRSINDLLPFVGQEMIQRLFEAASSKD